MVNTVRWDFGDVTPTSLSVTIQIIERSSNSGFPNSLTIVDRAIFDGDGNYQFGQSFSGITASYNAINYQLTINGLSANTFYILKMRDERGEDGGAVEFTTSPLPDIPVTVASTSPMSVTLQLPTYLQNFNSSHTASSYTPGTGVLVLSNLTGSTTFTISADNYSTTSITAVPKQLVSVSTVTTTSGAELTFSPVDASVTGVATRDSFIQTISSSNGKITFSGLSYGTTYTVNFTLSNTIDYSITSPITFTTREKQVVKSYVVGSTVYIPAAPVNTIFTVKNEVNASVAVTGGTYGFSGTFSAGAYTAESTQLRTSFTYPGVTTTAASSTTYKSIVIPTSSISGPVTAYIISGSSLQIQNGVNASVGNYTINNLTSNTAYTVILDNGSTYCYTQATTDATPLTLDTYIVNNQCLYVYLRNTDVPLPAVGNTPIVTGVMSVTPTYEGTEFRYVKIPVTGGDVLSNITVSFAGFTTIFLPSITVPTGPVDDALSSYTVTMTVINQDGSTTTGTVPTQISSSVHDSTTLVINFGKTTNYQYQKVNVYLYNQDGRIVYNSANNNKLSFNGNSGYLYSIVGADSRTVIVEIPDLSVGITYRVGVTIVNGDSESAMVYAPTTLIPYVPAPPSNFTITGYDGRLQLKFTPSTSPVNEIDYRLKLTNKSTGATLVDNLYSSPTSFNGFYYDTITTYIPSNSVPTDVINGTEYEVFLWTELKSRLSSTREKSTIVSASGTPVAGAVYIPSNQLAQPVVLSKAVGDRSITITWGAVANADSYILWLVNDTLSEGPTIIDSSKNPQSLGHIIETTATSATISNLTNGTTYYYTVQSRAGAASQYTNSDGGFATFSPYLTVNGLQNVPSSMVAGIPVAPTPVGAGSGAVCFLGDAPVLTPRGYRPIREFAVGDSVMTADGREVAISRVFRKAYSPSTVVNPYVIPKGSFSATRSVAISPNHEVLVAGRGMVKARDLGLKRMKMMEDFTYYNLELEDWVRDNLVVAGVTCESLAPANRITMTKTEFARFVTARYGPEAAKRLRTVCFEGADGRVSMPALR